MRTATDRAEEPLEEVELPARAFRRHLTELPVARYELYHQSEQRKAELRASEPPPQ